MNMIFSFSRLKLYETCPYRFRQKYIEGRDEPVTQPLALGKAVHKAIESRIKGCSESEALLNGMVDSDFHPDVSINELKQLVNKAPVIKGMGETELYFKLPLSGDPQAPEIQGYMDLVQEGEYDNSLWDWKTNYKAYHALDNHQLGLYAWALMTLKGTPTVNGRLYFLRYRKVSQHRFTEQDAERSRKWAYDLAVEINSKCFLHDIMPEKTDEIFPAIPSSACRHCPVAIDCFRKFSHYTG